jgi:ligand-binding SRPBCC domain-containing protein
MKLFSLSQTQDLPISLNEAWDFFSSPRNLDAITPPDLAFEITCDLPARMFQGQIISYRIGLLPGIRVNWITEIKWVEEGRCFVDEQRFGPYAFWYHRHTFDEIDGGVRIGDQIHYGVPFGPLGLISHPFLVKPKLDRIFTFRKAELRRRFGTL